MSSTKAVGHLLLLVCIAAVLPLPAAVAAEEDAPRGWLGVQVRDLNEGEAEELGFEKGGGVYVVGVVPGSPAARAGVKAGDVLTWAKTRVTNLRSLFEALSDTKPGQVILIGGWRPGGGFEAEIRLGEMPAELREAREGEPDRRRAELDRERAEVDRARADAAKKLEYLTRALVQAAKDGEKDRIPGLVEQVGELSMHLAELERRAYSLGEKREEAAAQRERAREERRREGEAGLAERLEALEGVLHRLRGAVERMQREIEELKRGR